MPVLIPPLRQTTRSPQITALFRWFASFLLAVSASGCASLPVNSGRPASAAFNAPDQTPLGRLVLERKAQERARADSAFNLLDSEERAFSGRLALIDSARRSLDLQYYAIHADSSTEVLLQGLRDAARRGVRVRILMDDFNTVGADAQVLRLAFEPNVEMRLFNPLSGSRDSLLSRLLASLPDMARVQKRMHNKVFIADSAMAIIGGRNLGDAYFGGDGQSNFVDLEVLAVGHVVAAMSASFDRYWNDELAYPMQTLVSAEDLEKLRKPDATPGKGPSQIAVKLAEGAPVSAPTAPVLPDATATMLADVKRQPMDLRHVPLTWAPAMLMVDAPGKIGPGDDEVDRGETVVDGLLDLMQQARQDVLIVSPYFVPGEPMMTQFRQLRAKGIRVRVLTNSLASNDAPAAHAGYARYRKALVAIGVEVYEMRAAQEGPIGGTGSADSSNPNRGATGSKSGSRASLHSKVVVIDQRWAVIGSMNLDLRSQRKNSEIGLLIRSAAMSRQASAQIEATFAQGAYRLALDQGELVWCAPRGAAFADARSEPEAGTALRLMVRLIAPFAPDEML
jgi:cardiolipin synthase C